MARESHAEASARRILETIQGVLADAKAKQAAATSTRPDWGHEDPRISRAEDARDFPEDDGRLTW
jgi:hypothetical protein